MNSSFRKCGRSATLMKTVVIFVLHIFYHKKQIKIKQGA